MEIEDMIEHVQEIQHQMDILNGAKIYVGVDPQNDHMTMIALVQEYGKHIAAKNYPYLVIPTAGAQGQKASMIPGLYKRGMTLGVDDPDAPGGYRVCFVLKQSVDIPARPFLRNTFNHNSWEWENIMKLKAQQVLNGQVKAKEALQIVADHMKNDIQSTIITFQDPHNAPLTAERKGRDDPLVDQGNLWKSIQTFIETKEE